MGTFQFSVRWHALGREAELAAEQLAAGVTALGRANHAQRGYYSQAFFGMSIGFERAAKLIIIADHAIREHGSFPTSAMIRCKRRIRQNVEGGQLVYTDALASYAGLRWSHVHEVINHAHECVRGHVHTNTIE